MLKIIIITLYRILVCLVVTLPIIINYIVESSIVTSFIYIPLLCLFLAFIAIYIDKKVLTTLYAIRKKKDMGLSPSHLKMRNLSPENHH
ncbi:hypothetical protein [Colwellia sp. UCD-KL20]|uniref:hypothetical protein n=1 Tax=Colwellia sp. UCD-KL20 TaxID=1917165 RepID=UPI0011773DA5|nr:hypothetical protein [Colwellia sp. UCD-KL20]